MSNLLEIQHQIDKLQKQANEIKSREFDKTVGDIRAKMTAFGITLKDLQPTRGSRKSKTGRPVKEVTVAKGPQKARVPVAAKYRGPNGEVWSGRGLTPRWLAILIAQGKSKESFAIDV